MITAKLLWYVPKEEKDIIRYSDDTEDDIQNSTRYNYICHAIVEITCAARFLLIDMGDSHRSFQLSHSYNDIHVYWERKGKNGVVLVNDPVVSDSIRNGSKLG